MRRRSKSGSFSQALAEGLTGPNLEGGVEPNPALDSNSDKNNRKGFSYNEIPWGEIFSNPVSLTLFFNMFTYGWIGYMVMTELPSFLTDVLGKQFLTIS